MTFKDGLKFTYQETSALVRKGWWLVVVPVAPVMAYLVSYGSGVLPENHLEEISIGVDIATSLLVVCSTYWVIRFVALGHNLGEAVALNVRSLRTFVPFCVFMSIVDLSLVFLANHQLLVSMASSIVKCLFAPWAVMAPSGSDLIGPLKSLRLAAPRFIWALVFFGVALLPFDIAILFLGGVARPEEFGIEVDLALSLVVQGVFALSVVVQNVAVYVIASRMGVRVDRPNTIEKVFD